MFRSEDLDTAVARRVITTEQAAAITTIARERRDARTFALGREERFRLLGGFNDAFIAIGVVLLGIAVMSTAPVLGLLAMWALAELLTGRFKLVAPGIVIVVFLSSIAGAVFGDVFAQLLPLAAVASDRAIAADNTVGFALAVAAMTALHYARFRFPFSLFVLAGALVTAALAVLSAVLEPSLGAEALGVARSWIALGLGLLVFIAAMWFDIADPERTTRRADCGFWLHLLAAPLIVHPVASTLITHPLFGRAVGETQEPSIALVLGLVALLAVLALVVDRRALLVAGLAYLGAAMAYGLSKLTGGSGTVMTLALMGAMIIVLGIGWREIRAALMSRLPDGAWKRGLPPYERPQPT